MTDTIRPLVTVGIPTYNRADCYLPQALESTINQTYHNIEIIISDNGSTDNTEMVVKKFSDPRIRYFKQHVPLRPSDNANFCLEQAKGDYFLQLHDDDMIDSDFIEAGLKAADYNPDIGIIRTGIRIIDSNGKEIGECRNQVKGLSTKDFFRGWFAGKTAWYLCNTLFNTVRIKELGGFKSKKNLLTDGVAIVQLADFGRIDVEDVKASFRVHSEELTFSAEVNDWCDDYLSLLDLMCEVTHNDVDLRHEGMRWCCRQNYTLTRKIKSFPRRLITFAMVYRKFNYCYSPLSYLCSQQISRITQYLHK